RIVIELRHDVNPQVMLNQLYKNTQMQDSLGIIMLALVNGEPKELSLKAMLDHYLKHQEEVVTRRTQFDLKKAEERNHILEGLLIALDNIDEVIKIIRGSRDTASAKEQLMARFALSDVQAQAIVDMRLRALTGLEREKLEEEHAELLEKIKEYKAILADEKLLLGVIRTEITEIAEKYGEDRLSAIEYTEADIDMEDLVPNEQTVIAMTSLGYIKRMGVDNFHAQNRGGKGIKGISTIENDYVEDLLMTKTHNHILFFTNFGRVYTLKAYRIPEASRTSRGVAIVNLLQLAPNEKISAIIPIKGFEEGAGKHLFLATKNGTVKKTPIEAFANIRKNGLNAITIREGDELIEVKLTSETSHIFMVTKYGMSIRFKETDVRAMGRSASGVRGIMLQPGDEVVGMQLDTQGPSLLIVSEKGYGKRTKLEEFTLQHRGGKGLKCYKITEKTGDVVGVKAVGDEHELMMITNAGTIIQLRMDDINVYSRITSGVKMINVDEGVTVAKIAKVRADADFEKEKTEGEGG
ncbi:MAG: DNA gyrase subunit A, partial [Lachnospiraceae bacterium]|nr:DNA gyrase subunit A [Lachnospiraceae bacterium]